MVGFALSVFFTAQASEIPAKIFMGTIPSDDEAAPPFFLVCILPYISPKPQSPQSLTSICLQLVFSSFDIAARDSWFYPQLLYFLTLHPVPL